MAKFRKKPVVIDAEQYFEHKLPWPLGVEERIIYEDNGNPPWKYRFIRTLEGEHDVSEGDWIITGVKGERYPCKPDIFAMTYEAVQ